MDVPAKTAPRLFLIDAYALIYRAYYAFISRPLTNSAGENTSAPYGFVTFLIDIREQYEPDYLAIVFDAGTSYREEVYPEYKATREKMPEDLRESIPRVQQLVEAFHDPVIRVEGYEADDVIGTLARQAREEGLEAVIVSGDKDFYQLVGEGVHLMNPGRGGPQGVSAEWVDESNASEKFGIPPSQVIDYLALIGDSSDNVPGAPGIGPKTAVKLLQKYPTVEELIAHAGEISGRRARESLQENADQVRLSKELVTIIQDLDVKLDLEALKVREPDRARLREIFVELEFRRLLEKYASDDTLAAEEGETTEYGLVTSTDEVEALVQRIRDAGRVALHARSSTRDPLMGELAGVALAVEEGEAFYLPFGHQAPFELTFEGEGPDEPENLPSLESASMKSLRDMLSDATVAKVGHDLKLDLLVLSRGGVELRGLAFDTMIAAYVLDPGRRVDDVGALSVDRLGIQLRTYADVAGKGQKERPFSEVPVAEARDFAGERADAALRLRDKFARELEDQDMDDLFRDLEMPLVRVLARMERNGIRIDEGFFQEMSRRLVRELELIQEEIFKVAGEEFNLNSTHQLREILFDKLDLPVIKRTKTGPSTDASVLEELATEGHQIPRLLLEYRQLEKLRNTYVDALPRLVNPRTGRIHTSFNQTVAATGRLSSSDPNLQNIPIRTDLGREIRKGFVADEGRVFLGADYSQIELRILAHFSGDEAFVTAFREGIDVHKQTASVIFEVSLDQVTADMRARAKTINFATLYGQGAFSLARDLGIPRDEAKQFIEEYFERFSGVRRFLDSQVEQAKESGYVETLSGRRRFIPELESSNWSIRQFGVRVAQNTPIQGTAADMIKLAMIAIHRRLEDGDFGAELLLQVHDELLFEVDEDGVDALRAMAVEEMEGAMELTVPLVVDVGVGRDWYSCKG